MSAIGAGLPIVTTIFSYFHPSRSPYYSVIAFGTLSLILSTKIERQGLWLQVAVPIYAVLLISWILSFKSRPAFSTEEHEDQLKFVRSFSISTGLLTFALIAQKVESNALAFWANYAASITQILVFLLYAYARNKREEHGGTINFVQFALITTSFLVGASYGLDQAVRHLESSTRWIRSLSETDTQIRELEAKIQRLEAAGDKKEIDRAKAQANEEKDNRAKAEKSARSSREMANRFLGIVGGLYGFWLACILIWLRHLLRLVEFLRIKDEVGSQ